MRYQTALAWRTLAGMLLLGAFVLTGIAADSVLFERKSWISALTDVSPWFYGSWFCLALAASFANWRYREPIGEVLREPKAVAPFRMGDSLLYSAALCYFLVGDVKLSEALTRWLFLVPWVFAAVLSVHLVLVRWRDEMDRKRPLVAKMAGLLE